MPPKEELFRPFENVLRVASNGAETGLEWFSWSYFLWFRPLGAPVDLLWFYPFVTSWDSWGATAEQLRQHAESGVKVIWSRQLYFRAIPLSDEKGLWVAMQPNKVGVVVGEGEHYANWNTAAFQMLSFESIRDAPLEQLLGTVRDAIEADFTEWKDVLKWAQLEPISRFWSLVSWEEGNSAEWMILMRALLQLSIRREPFSERIIWDVKIPFVRKPPTVPVPLGMKERGLSTCVRELIRLAQKDFGATVDYCRCRKNVEGPFFSELLAPQVEIYHPSQHERMEALALWRDFGRRSNQLTRVEELLSELLA